MTASPWHICVLIPARNEEVLLPRCLRSVLKASARLPANVTFDIVVAVDSSTDMHSHDRSIDASWSRSSHTDRRWSRRKSKSLGGCRSAETLRGPEEPLLACQYRCRLLRTRVLADRSFVLCNKRCRSHRRHDRR